MKFNTLMKQVEQDYPNDTGQCALVATAIALEIPYEKSYQMYTKAGRRIRKGTNASTIFSVVKAIAREKNFKIRTIKPKSITSKTITCNNQSKYLDDSKNYIALVDGHALAIRRGIVEDWTRGKRHRIQTLLEVTTPEREKKLIDINGLKGIDLQIAMLRNKRAR